MPPESRQLTPPATQPGFVRRLGRKLAGLVVSLVVLAGVVAAYLHRYPIPTWLQEPLELHLARRGLYVDATDVRLDWRGRIEASSFRWYDSGLRVTPVLETDTLSVRFRVEWRDGPRIQPERIVVRDGTVRWAAGRRVHGAPEADLLVAESVNADVEALPASWRIHTMEGSVRGLRMTVAGDLPRTGRAISAPEPPEGADSSAWTTRAAAWIRELQGVSFGAGAALDLELVPSEAGLYGVAVRLKGGGGTLALRGMVFDDWGLDTRLFRHQLEVDRVALSSGTQTLQAQARVRLPDWVVEGSIRSSLSASHLHSLAPVSWRDWLDRNELFLPGDLSWEVSLGPAPVADLWRGVAGTVTLKGASLKDVWVSEATADVRIHDADLEIANIQAAVGRPPHHGRITGDFAWNFEEATYRGEVTAALDLFALLPVLSRTLKDVVHRFLFEEDPPVTIAAFSGRLGAFEAFQLDGTVRATNFFYRGTYAEQASTVLRIRDRRVLLDGLHVQREEGDMDGWIRVDSPRGVVDFEAVTTAQPAAVARAVADPFERALRNISFLGPTRAVASGQIAYRTNQVSDVRATVVAEQLGVGPFKTGYARTDLYWLGQRIALTNIQAALYEGTVEGALAIEMDSGPASAGGWSARGKVSDVLFEEVVRMVAHKEGEPHRGRLGGTFDLRADLGEDWRRSAVGQGTVSITDGRVLALPLFGGLSKILSRVYPGLGFARQTDLYADWDLAAPRVAMKPVRMEGSFFSLRAEGLYEMIEHQLDFDVEFQLLREGLVSTVLRVVTRPLTKLLEFDLEGTVQDPVWRPKNLPRELFVGFEDE